MTSTCRICREEKNDEDVRELSCHHKFCSMCMMVYPGTLCPTRFCTGTRSKDVVVDEMAGMDDSGFAQISFGSTSTLFKVEIEEKLKCEGIRKGLYCVNIARMVLIHCRHRLCYDCLFEKLQSSWDNKAVPHCPMPRCCNTLSSAEIQTLGTQSSKFTGLCEEVVKKLPTLSLPCEPKPSTNEIMIECFVYGREHNKKTIVLPKMCFVVDAVNAVIQLLRFVTNQSTTSLDVFVRKDCPDKKGKYKYEKISIEGKLSIKDALWTDPSTIVIDAEKQILRKRR